MKLKPSRNHLDKINLNIKLFQTIKIPEKNKVICQIQKFINNLGNSIKLLETPNSKKKINNGKFIHPSKSLLIKHKIHKKRKYLLSHSSNKSDINELTNNEYTNNIKNIKLSIKPRIYSDKLSLLKEKNKTITNKILKSREKSEDNSMDTSNYTMNKYINDKKFVSSFDIPNIKMKKEDIEMMSTELSENNKNINYLNYKDSLPKIRSKSSSRNNSDSLNSSNTFNSDIIRPNNSLDVKIKNNKFMTRNKSDINIIRTQNPINFMDNCKNKKKYDINKLNKKLISLFRYDYKHSKPSSPEMTNFIKGLKKQRNYINKKNYENELLKWLMNSKMKETEWKIGINNLEKYFVDVDEYRIKEKIESELKKGSDKNIALLIDDLKEENQINEIKQIKKKYGINDKNIEDSEYYYIGEKYSEKLKEESLILKRMKERKIKEQKSREIIEYILLKNKQKVFNIINS